VCIFKKIFRIQKFKWKLRSRATRNNEIDLSYRKFRNYNVEEIIEEQQDLDDDEEEGEEIEH
jgi:hypothetical protein